MKVAGAPLVLSISGQIGTAFKSPRPFMISASLFANIQDNSIVNSSCKSLG
jgi:hypothetical protein